MKIVKTAQSRSDFKRRWDVLVDDEDYENVKNYHWQVGQDNAVRGRLENGRHILMHRFILDAPESKEVDHINGNPLDNRRSNLRLCNSSQNKCNRGPRKDNKSGYKGVSWHSQRDKWTARIKVGDKYKHLGLFEDIQDAAEAYNSAAKKYHKEFAYSNY